MSDINNCTFSGRLGANPDLKTIGSGTHVLEFRLAVDTYAGKDKGNKTEWLNCTMFGPRAEKLAQILEKGSGVTIVATYRQDTSEKDGVKRYFSKFIVNELALGAKKFAGSDGSNNEPNF